MCGFHCQLFVKFDAKLCWCFFLGDWLLVDSELKLLFDVGEGEAGGHCLYAVDGDTPIQCPLWGVVKHILHFDGSGCGGL